MLFALIFFAELILLYFLSRKLVTKIFRLFYRLTKNRDRTSYLLAILFIPGTFVHEISHVLAALFLLVPFGEVELLPKIEGSGIKLGSVGIGKTDPLRRFLVGIAPFIIGTSLILGGLYYFILADKIQNTYLILLITYFVFAIGNTMFASKKDMEGAIKLFLFLFFVCLLLILLGLKLPFLNIRNIFTDKFAEVLEISDIFLLVPLAINSLIIITLKFLRM